MPASFTRCRRYPVYRSTPDGLQDASTLPITTNQYATDDRVMVNSPTRTFFVGLLAAAAVFVAGCGSSNQARLPAEADNPNVVAVFNDEILTLDEFEQRYVRSSGSLESAREDSLGSYEDFLERYVNFRLKVRAAEEAGIPELPSVQNEIRSYRSNLARPYLLEQEVLEPLVQTLYERQQKMVDVSHILLRVDPDAAPADTLAAFERISALRDSVLEGQDFGEVALKYSEDPSARRAEGSPGYKGRLGPFTAGRLIEPFETFAYQTAVDEVSPVFRTRFGYHFLKVHDVREAVPDVRLSHVMIRPTAATAEDSAAALELIIDLKRQLDEGADFAELARQHSVDVQSRGRGGDLGIVGFDAPIHPSFKEPAFALEEVGDVSGVVETPYGFHLIKLTGREEPKTYEESYDELKKLVTRLPRAQAAEEALAWEVFEAQNATIDSALVRRAFEGIPADSVFARLVGKQISREHLADTVFVIGDSTYTLNDVAEATMRSTAQGGGGAFERALALVEAFVTKQAIDFEAARLEERDDEFKRLMDEFRDGLVLFQFMEDSVWTAAEQDSAALVAYYDAHRDEYWWPERTRVVSLQSPSDSLLAVAARRLEAGTPVAEVYADLAADTLNTIRMDTTMIADSTSSIYDRALGLDEGAHTEALPYRGQHIILVNQGVEAPRAKTFEEARTQVVSDYQTIVEDRLIERLRERYNAHTYPQRLVNAYEQNPARPAEMTSGG